MRLKCAHLFLIVHKDCSAVKVRDGERSPGKHVIASNIGNAAALLWNRNAHICREPEDKRLDAGGQTGRTETR